MSLRTAQEQLRVAHALTTLPAIARTFAAGRLSYSKVRAITRIATPETEQALLDLALAGTATHVERIVRVTRQATGDPIQATHRRALRWNFDADGDLRMSIRLPAEDGARLLAAITTLVDSQLAGTKPADPTDQPADAEPAESLAARRADALLTLVTSSKTVEPELVVHLRVDQHDAPLDTSSTITAKGGACRGTVGVPTTTAERLACQTRVRALLTDRRGNPLYLGRTRRLVAKTLLAALEIRDRHQCRFPGCTATRNLAAHHIQHWLRGGRTDIDNLILLCPHHHRLVHECGYRVCGPAGRLVFQMPTGEPIPQAGPPTEGNLPSLLRTATRHRVPRPEGLTPTWAGEPLDPTPILMRLLPRQRTARNRPAMV